MSDLIQLVSGAPPWTPSPDSDERAILDEYNIPLAGVLQQHGVSYFYVCAAGEEEDSNVWLYAMIEEPEVAELRSHVGPSFIAAMKSVLKHRAVTAALADHNELMLWETFEAGDDEPGVLVRRFLRLLEARVKRFGDNIDRLENDPSIDAGQGQLAIQ